MNDPVSHASRRAGIAWVAGSAASFGAMAIFARHAYAGGADVVAVLFLRFAIAALTLCAIVGLGRRVWPGPRNIAILAAMGGIGYVGQSLSFFSALKYASAGLVALLLYLYPFIVTVLGAVLTRTRLSRRRVLLILTALLGTALTIGGEVAGQPLGVLLGVGAALIYSVYILVGERVLAREDPLASAAVVMSAAAVVFGGLALWQQPAFPASLAAWGAVLAIALISTVIAMVGFFIGVRRLGAPDAATLSTLEPVVTMVLEPVVTMVLAAVFLDEFVTPLQMLGAGIVLLAVIVLVRGSGR
ncbi:MAG: EamA family transporter [Candidatus Dactylopiibacterium carminicum]|uniref:EamA family transporter n=1 Tax=Candidatus Dactylopiibacterium carminicum TaxID=857335 RepID=A0A272EN32_9RHOO|nr:DMT family transporter [Candidatus Dactylopiibacterium carminicum]KAF7597928.1 EamA/RhaT family transporter [Candidatus Dactylopiibacterium carminicum]PAS91502.1 MAG: EamA family transporter [Candidatus Dactylopiibacterium carminicum]PAS93048.1 MAG: EamA family transporter [Candidatus Dactylopiibacterium carminicum]PAS96028.1 MAG: EamA family transporter [Candidatus Dactylopiibacterium carminicum]